MSIGYLGNRSADYAVLAEVFFTKVLPQMNYRNFSAAMLLALLTGCVETTSMAARPVSMDEATVSAGREMLGLFDPYSAQFRQEAVYQLENGNYVYCGQVNAKNRYGAYVGHTDFYVRFSYSNGLASMYRSYTDVTARLACDEARRGLITGVVADAVAI